MEVALQYNHRMSSTPEQALEQMNAQDSLMQEKTCQVQQFRMGFATLNKDFIPELLLTPSSDFATLRGSLESVHYFEGLAVLANP